MVIGRGYKAILYGKEVPPTEDLALDPVADANWIHIRNSNKQAYRDLVLACTDNVSFEIIDSAVLDKLLSRDAAEGFQQLGNYWEPNMQSMLNYMIKKYQLETLKMLKTIQ